MGALACCLVDKFLQSSYAERTSLAILVAMKMRFGKRLQTLRKAKGFTLRDLAAKVGVGFTYICKVENGKMAFADYPSDDLIVKLAAALDADADELLIMAKKIPPQIRKRVLERPDAFRTLAELDDQALDVVMAGLDGLPDANASHKPRASRK